MDERLKESATALATTLIGTRDDWRLRVPPRPTRPAAGPQLIGATMAVGSILVGWFAFDGTIGDGSAGLALFIGSVSILMMAWSNLLATRAAALEQLFGGLDRMYRWHRWFGALSVGAMWLHIQTVDDVKGIAGASRDVADAAEELAETGSNLLYILVAISLLRWLPYRWWRLSHKLLVLPYAFACWHFYTATKPYANDSAWGLWFTAFMLLGLVAWAHRVLWRDMVRRGRAHRVEAIHRSGDTVEIALAPIGEPLRHRLGQFAFLKVAGHGMSEPHPFTIASAPGERVLRFVIRDLGDWSGTLADRLAVGDRVVVEGPYGRLEPLPDRPVDGIVWIAGGVGITPFLGAATSRTPGHGPTPLLLHCVRSRHDAPGLADLERAAAEGRIDLRVLASEEGNRLTVDGLRQHLGGRDLRSTHVVMCGPEPLVRTMAAACRDLGAETVHVEGFDIRTGVGPDLSRQLSDVIASLLDRWAAGPFRRRTAGSRTVTDGLGGGDRAPGNDETPAGAGVRGGAKGN